MLKNILLSIVLTSALFFSSCTCPQSPILSPKLESEIQKNLLSKMFEDHFGVILDKEIIRSQIPVILISKERFTKDFYEKSRLKILEKKYNVVVGLYIRQVNVKGFPREFIFISNELDSMNALIAFHHETGHYLCRKRNCNCLIYEDKLLNEFHAYRYSLEKALEIMSEEFIVENLLDIIKTVSYGDVDDYHTKACMKIMNSSCWDDCLRFLYKKDIQFFLEKKD